MDKGIYNIAVHHLYHRQFWETVESIYLPTQEEKEHVALHLAKFFNGDFSSPFTVPFVDQKRNTSGRQDRLIAPQPLMFTLDSSKFEKSSFTNDILTALNTSVNCTLMYFKSLI